MDFETRKNEAVKVLGELYADDKIGQQEFEKRIAQIEGAKDFESLEPLIEDLDLPALYENQGTVFKEQAPPHPPSQWAKPSEDVSCIFAEQKISALDLDAQQVTTFGLMSSLELDYRDIYLPEGITEIDVTHIMSSLTIYVPDDVQVQLKVQPLMAECKDKRKKRPDRAGSPCILRITGTAFMAEVVVKN
ncbi:MAG: LiaF domain-containing protein [Spirochaetia bacterium]